MATSPWCKPPWAIRAQRPRRWAHWSSHEPSRENRRRWTMGAQRDDLADAIVQYHNRRPEEEDLVMMICGYEGCIDSVPARLSSWFFHLLLIHDLNNDEAMMLMRDRPAGYGVSRL